MSVFIAVLHRGNIWIADSMSRQLRSNLKNNIGTPALFGLGVYCALREAEQLIGATIANDDGISLSIIGSSTAGHCQDAVLAYATESNTLGVWESVFGARFVAAVFGLRALTESKSPWIAKAAQNSLAQATALAEELRQTYIARLQQTPPDDRVQKSCRSCENSAGLSFE